MQAEQELSGKVALITGAGSGIGQASALLLARQGAVVGLLGRIESELREVEAKIKNLTGTFFTIKFSVPHLKRHGGSVIVRVGQWHAYV